MVRRILALATSVVVGGALVAPTGTPPTCGCYTTEMTAEIRGAGRRLGAPLAAPPHWTTPDSGKALYAAPLRLGGAYGHAHSECLGSRATGARAPGGGVC